MRRSFFMTDIAVSISLGRALVTTFTLGGPATTTIKSSAAETHTVTVGLQHDFNPNTIKANPGDTVRFEFYPKNHSVVRADFEKPCIPWELTNDPVQSFFSGAVEQDTLQDPKPTWDLLVNDTDPVFFYCSAPDSCLKWGMVGVINPNDTFTLAIQKEFQENSTFQLSPGEAFPDEGSPSSTTTSSGVPASTSSWTAASTNLPTGSDSTNTSLSGGAIAGIVIGVAAVIVIVVALVYVCGRKGGIEKGYRQSIARSALPLSQMVDTGYENGPKSPPLNSAYSLSSYRSLSPAAAWTSQMGSPHTSYVARHSSPGFPQYGPIGNPYSPVQEEQTYLEAPDTQKQPPPSPVELPANQPRY
ncbi:hypothetical protein GGR53DRAFT_184251 [Hypoxylon sp. FL1150]|nr:hypothetical protein GGR53DRAFT_184251 [Hypoxylon sp. FL1150]